MKKRILKITALVMALALIAGLAWFANGLVGNPVSRLLAKRALDRYVEETYPHLDLNTERFGFDFKSIGYFAYVRSEGSMDTAFYIDMDMLGHVTYDSYDTWVTGKLNTERRVQEQYRQMAYAVLNSSGFAYESDIKGGMLEFALDFVQDREVGDDRDYDYAIPREELVMDKEYTPEEIRDLGARAGILTVYVMEDTVTVERAAQIMLHIRSLFDDAGVPFYRMDFVLRYPKPADGSPWPDGDVRAALCYEDIREEGLVQRIRDSHAAIYEGFAEMDKEKDIVSSSND